MKISIGNSRMEKKWMVKQMKWEDFRELISSTKRTSETVEEYKGLSKKIQDEIKDVGGFVLGELKNGKRRRDSVISRSGLTLDMDYGTLDIIDEIEMLHGFKCYFYSTHKHTNETPRFRLIIPLSRDVSPDEYTAIGRKVADEIGINLFDDTTYEPSRLMYWPSTSKDGDFVFREINGEVLNPDEVLSRYKDWRNSSEWPVSERETRVVKRNIKKQADPMLKEGIVGVFCRAYSITLAIDTFLSDVYRKSETPLRYDYIKADSQAGVVIYEGKYAYSHHGTDPANGMLMNAFDVVRIHKFGYLGDDSRKTFKAMQDFAIKDERVKLQLAKERENKASEEFEVVLDSNWQSLLELNKQGKIKDTLTNIANIIRHDENLKNIVYNEFKSSIDVVGDLPWSQVRPGWGDADLSCAKVYFEKIYGIWSPMKFRDALIG